MDRIIPYIILIVSTAGLIVAAASLIFAVLPEERKYWIRIRLRLLKKPDMSVSLIQGGNSRLKEPRCAVVIRNEGVNPPFPVILELWTSSDWSIFPGNIQRQWTSERVLNETKHAIELPIMDKWLEMGSISRNSVKPDFNENAPIYYKLICAGMVIKGPERLHIPISKSG